MSVLNPRFEEAGSGPGEASHWRLRSVCAHAIATFDAGAAEGIETFELWSAFDTVLESIPTVIALFDPRREAVEDFEEAWANDTFVWSLQNARAVAARFGSEPAEVWDGGTFVTSWDRLTAIPARFARALVETFGDGWPGAASVTSWGSVASEGAFYDQGFFDIEGFEGAWPTLTTI